MLFDNRGRTRDMRKAGVDRYYYQFLPETLDRATRPAYTGVVEAKHKQNLWDKCPPFLEVPIREDRTNRPLRLSVVEDRSGFMR